MSHGSIRRVIELKRGKRQSFIMCLACVQYQKAKRLATQQLLRLTFSRRRRQRQSYPHSPVLSSRVQRIILHVSVAPNTHTHKNLPILISTSKLSSLIRCACTEQQQLMMIVTKNATTTDGSGSNDNILTGGANESLQRQQSYPQYFFFEFMRFQDLQADENKVDVAKEMMMIDLFFYGNQIFFYVEYDVWPSLWSSGPVSFAFRLWFSIPTIAERSSYSWDLICWNLLIISCTHSMHHRWWLKVLRREERHACMASVCMCNSTRSK